MVLSFVLVNVEYPSADDAMEKVMKVKGVKEAYFLHGIYDIIAKIEGESLEEAKQTIFEIRHLDKVKSTVNLIVTH